MEKDGIFNFANSLEFDLGKIVAHRASIIFDLDGTLIDSAKDIQWVANTALSKIELLLSTMRKQLVLLEKVLRLR